MDHREAVETLACERYLLGEMTDAERDAFEAHFFSCRECGDDVRLAGRMREGVRAGLLGAAATSNGATVRPFPRPARRWRPAVVLPWAVAASMAIVAGYESFHAATVQHASEAPLALAPVTLRPATRGDDAPTIGPGPGNVITLAVDLGGAQVDGGVIRYEIAPDGGSAVAAGDATMPPPGAPLLLMIPSKMLQDGGPYVLTVKNPRNLGLTLNEYRFTVQTR